MGRDTDFPLSGAIHELCAIAVASIVASAHWSARHGAVELTAEEIGQVGDILTEVNQILGTTLPAVGSNGDLRSPELSTAVDRLLLGCEILWQTFELPQLRDSLGVRRAQFNGMCVEITVQNFGTHARSVQTLRSLEGDDLLALLANLVVADRLRKVTALATPYTVRAGKVALHGRFGAGLRHEVAFMVVLRGKATALDLGEFIEELLAGAGPAGASLSRLLGGLSPGAFCGSALRFLEAARASTRPDLEARVREALAPAVVHLAEPVRAEAQALLDVSALREQLKRGARVVPASVLEDWHQRRDFWTYAWVLDLLLDDGHDAPELLSESVATLQRDPSSDRFSTHFFLAVTVGRHPATTKREDMAASALAYLKAGHARWERDLSPVANLHAFQVLERLDPRNRDTYRSRRVQWEYLKLELDHVERLPALLDQERFFDVFWDYCAGMTDWGLPTDTSALPELDIQESQAPAEERQRVVRGWLHRGGRLPSPWGTMQGHRAVSLTFLTLGRFVFAPPLADDPELVDARRGFNEAARVALPDLFRTVVALPRLPGALKELVGRFQGRFQQYASPDP